MKRDLACYGIEAPTPPSVELKLSHLNPVVRQLGAPDELVKLTTPRQLCVPVIKNNAVPPPAVRQLVQFIDLKCYDFVTDSGPLNLTLQLTHLNPVLRGMGLPVEKAFVQTPQQLCVPVLKNNQVIPPAVLNIVQWIDMKKYDITAEPVIGPVPLTIRHINPLLATRPPEQIRLLDATQLALPVAKNGQIPVP